MGRATGEIYQDRSKGKDVRTSNIVSAKVNSIFLLCWTDSQDTMCRYL